MLGRHRGRHQLVSYEVSAGEQSPAVNRSGRSCLHTLPTFTLRPEKGFANSKPDPHREGFARSLGVLTFIQGCHSFKAASAPQRAYSVHFPAPCGSSQPSAAPLSKNMMPSSVLCENQEHKHTYTNKVQLTDHMRLKRKKDQSILFPFPGEMTYSPQVPYPISNLCGYMDSLLIKGLTIRIHIQRLKF